jgi:CubicO group peptidase (beta-lactamase class C family)
MIHVRQVRVRQVRAFALAFSLGFAARVSGQAAYVPGPDDEWQRKRPDEAGLDAALLQQAIDFAVASETKAPADLEENHYLTLGREPFGDGIGPFKVRGPMSGIVVRGGYLVAEWGDTRRVDMTFSVTKSFVSTAIGLAWADGLIPNLHAPVVDQMAPMELPPGDGEPGIDRTGFGKLDPARLFESAHNRTITWDHLLRQTSDWEGTLWGKPDWADRPGDDVGRNRSRPRNASGSVYKYNDVRVNLLALAGLNVLRRPLPQVLRERVMDPIGASRTWRWNGYDNSWLNVDGHWVQSVSGGGHWGGGLLISARDQARFGLFTLRKGDWGGKRLLPAQWFEWATTPTAAQRGYGFMNYFLNVPDEQGKKRFPAAPDAAYAHLGNGANVIYVDPVNDLVVVARWIEASKVPEFVAKLMAAVRK